jgi:vesicle-fusing ATPase
VVADQVFRVYFNKNVFYAKIERIVGEVNLLFCQIRPLSNGEQQTRLASTKHAKKSVFQTISSMDSLRIIGLDTELINLLRRVFASRRLPHCIIEKYGIHNVKGILLYGPLGSGKSLIGRQVANCLKAKSVRIVNGPEVFSKYIGE